VTVAYQKKRVFEGSTISSSSFQSPQLPPHILGIIKQKFLKQNEGVMVIEVKLLNPPSSPENENSASTALSALSRRRTEMSAIIADIGTFWARIILKDCSHEPQGAEEDAKFKDRNKEEEGDEEGSIKELEGRLCKLTVLIQFHNNWKYVVWHIQRLCNIITQTREYDALCGVRNFTLKENILSPIDKLL